MLKIRLEEWGDNRLVFQILEQHFNHKEQTYICPITNIIIRDALFPDLISGSAETTIEGIYLRGAHTGDNFRVAQAKVNNPKKEIRNIKIALQNFVNYLKRKNNDTIEGENNIYYFN